ncbi:MAG: helix-turn-helix transcriptional regulator [Clostridia bacterium]|nr:helix-turn-helix transcriptional regulator [Clostridia bacterium]
MFQLDVDKILKSKNKTRYWLFNELNSISPMSYTNFNNMIDNRTKSIKYENLSKLCKILQCTPNDILIKRKSSSRK